MAFQINYTVCSASTKEMVEMIIADWNSGKAAFELKTSGSTGTPKLITHPRERFIQSAKRTNTFFGLDENSHVLLAISPRFIGGMMVLIRALVGNYCVTVTEAAGLEQHLPKESFDFVSLVPIQLEKLVQTNPDSLKQFKTILLGGTAIQLTLRDFLTKLHSNSYIGFGMTETVSHIALRKLDEDFYTCLPGVQLKNTANHLIINDSELKITDLETTDEIELLDEKRFIWLGRRDFVINSGGIKIHPEQLESKLQAFIDGPFIIGGIPDAKLGEKCVLILAENSQLKSDFPTLQNLVKEAFSSYYSPKEIIRTAFIFNEQGKVLRRNILNHVVNQPQHDQK